jgi:thioredoxin reductase (NADPH)
MLDLIIIGGGVAGLSAGLYASRGMMKTVLLERENPGGQILLTGDVQNYPGIEKATGYEIGTKVKDHALKFGLDIKKEQATNVELFDDHVKVITDKGEHEAQYLIVATGSAPRELNIPGENEFRGKGVSYCATCDGAFFKDKHVMVVGGGNSALDEALFLTKFASKITMVHRKEVFSGEKILQEEVMGHDKIEVMFNHEVKEVMGEQMVNKVKLFNNKENKELDFDVDGVFVFIGYIPNSMLLGDAIKCEGEEIVTDINMKTSHDRVYAAGDVRCNAVKQLVSSAGDGATASLRVMQVLRGVKTGS